MRLVKAVSKRELMFYGLGLVVMWLSFSINLFGTGLWPSWFNNFQRDSEAIVLKTVDCQNSSKRVDYSGPIVPAAGQEYSIMGQPGCDKDKYQPYASQFGLQARVVAFFAPNTSQESSTYLTVVRLVLALSMAAVLILLVFFISREFGPVAAVTTFALLCISDWVVGYSRNMYWASFLMFLPFVFSLGYYLRFKAQAKLPYFYVLLAALFALKFLDGYEHATTLVISAFAPVMYCELKERAVRLLGLWREAALVLAAGVAGFGAAFLLNVISLQAYYHSWSKSVSAVTERAQDRTDFKNMQANVIVGFEATLPQIYTLIDSNYDLDILKTGQGSPVKYALLSALNYLLLPAVSLPVILRDPLGIFVQSIAAVGIAAFLCLRFMRRINPRASADLRAVTALYWLGLVAALSWLVMMPGHAYPHAHLNAIIFYMPFLIVCYIIIGIALGRWFPARPPKKI